MSETVEMIVGLLLGGIVTFCLGIAFHKAIEWGRKEGVIYDEKNDPDA